jgi:hypothetical protein
VVVIVLPLVLARGGVVLVLVSVGKRRSGVSTRRNCSCWLGSLK